MAKNDKKNNTNKTGKNIKNISKVTPNKNTNKTAPTGKLKIETKHTIWGVVFFALAVFFLMSLFDMTGPAGKSIYDFFDYLFGYGYVLLPLLFGLLGWSFIKSVRPNIGWTRAISATAFLLSGLSLIDIPSENHGGGILGRILSTPFVSLFDVYASIILLGAILIISILVMFDARPELIPFFKSVSGIFRKKQVENFEEEEEEDEKEDEEETEEEKETTSEKIKKALGVNKKETPAVAQIAKEEEEEFPIKKRKSGLISTYVPPPLTLLEEDKGKPNTGDVKANANIIKRTLANFGIEVEMDEITVGPTVTRYALKPAEGVKLSRIVGLQNDLALALAAHPIRIEAPIPGKSLVGIEIPNKSKSIVGLATLLSDEKYKNSPKPLTVALGRGISGKAVFGNLAKMPHALVAGTTGSGKSVTIHSMITSLLYRNGPDDLKLILIDPKRVELTLYNKIPHLLTPVITDAKKTILALKWAAKEMNRRY
ncbi:MAG: DNA translocase FtsK 4TM domain-containing protein, partial [bacterium]